MRITIKFLVTEKINNYNFNSIEFDRFKEKAGLNSFSITSKQGIEKIKQHCY